MALTQPASPKTALIDDERYSGAECSDLSRDGRHLAVASGFWKVFDLGAGKAVSRGRTGTPGRGGACAVRFSPNGELLAMGGNFNFLHVFNAKTGDMVWDLTREGHVDVIDRVLFTPDSKKLISVSGGEKRIRLWDVEKKQAEAAFHFTGLNTAWIGLSMKVYVEKAKRVYEYERSNEGFFQECILHPNGKTLAGIIYKGKVTFLDLDTGKITSTITSKQEMPIALRITPDGKWLFIGGCNKNGKDGHVEIWDLQKNEFVRSIAKHAGSAYRIEISPDMKHLITASDGFRVWDLASGQMKHHYFGKKDPRFPRVRIFEDGSKSEETTVASAGCGFFPDSKTFYIVPAWRFGGTEVFFYDTATGEPVDYRKRVAALPGK